MNIKKNKLRQLEARNRITVGELRKRLNGLPDDMQIVFGDTMDGNIVMFYRTKLLGENKLLIECNELKIEDYDLWINEKD